MPAPGWRLTAAGSSRHRSSTRPASSGTPRKAWPCGTGTPPWTAERRYREEPSVRSGLLDAGQHPAAVALAGLGQVPDFVDAVLRAIFAHRAGEVHADDVAASLFHHFQHLGVELLDLGALGGTRALAQVHLDLGKHLGRGELA